MAEPAYTKATKPPLRPLALSGVLQQNEHPFYAQPAN
jgi:hypothetical protein